MTISTHKKVLGTLAAGLVLSAAIASPARAANTTTTFVVSGGSLAINAPASKALSAVAVGVSSVSGQLGTVTVTDGRSVLGTSWTAKVSSTNFTTGSAGAGEVVDNANVLYTTGVATLASGTAVPLGLAVAASLDSQQDAATATNVLGNAVVTWDPLIAIQVPDTVAAGTYTGTITHSVA